MEKIVFLSDIHGSLFYLQSAIDRIKEERPDYIVLLGDLLYHGARNPLTKDYNPKEVTALLNSLTNKLIAVRGNCDSEVDAMVLDFPMTADYTIVLRGGKRLFLTHGHVFNESAMPRLNKGDAFIYGHTHIPRTECIDGIYMLNPGSIALPKEKHPHTYAVLEEDWFRIKEMDGWLYQEIRLS